MKPRQRSLTEHYAFLIGSLAVAPLVPVGFTLVFLFRMGIDGRASMEIGTGAVILALMAFTVLEYETDGLVSWVLGGGVQMPRLGFGYFVGMILKALAIAHGVAAVVFGSLLALEPDTLPSQLSSWPVDVSLGVKIIFVIWLWTMTAVTYLAGDGWIRRSRRADDPAGAGLE